MMKNLIIKKIFYNEKRKFWNKNEIFKILIVSWSPDLNKGFKEYKKIDENFRKLRDIQIKFIGNTPKGFKFKNIKFSKAISQETC